jgi:hypothetical protein
MRRFLSLVIGGAVLVSGVNAIASFAKRDLASLYRQTSDDNSPLQSVDRSHKGDRLHLPFANGKQMPPPATPSMLVGCEPVFSSLSASSRVNFPGRCVA